MTATAAQIAQLRRMVAEPTVTTYTDAALAGYVEAYPLVDEYGNSPRIPSTTTAGAMMDNPDWTATYDLNAAAAAIWTEKAAGVAVDYDFQADRASYNRSQVYAQYMQQARYYQSRRAAKTITSRPEPMKAPDLLNDDD